MRWLTILLLLIPVFVWARDPLEWDQDQDLRAVRNEPLMPLMTNQTVSVLGNDFARAFAVAWMSDPNNGDAELTIRDQFTQRAMLQIMVLSGAQTLLVTTLSPTDRFNLDRIGIQAVAIVRQKLQEFRVRSVLEGLQQRGN